MSTSMLRSASPPSARRAIALWLLWATVVSIVIAFGVWALHVLLDVPRQPSPWWALGLSAFVVPAVAVYAEPVRRAAGFVLRDTVLVGGVAAMVLAVYLVVVVGLGQDVQGSEHRVLWLSMVAGAVAVGLTGPVKARLRDATRAAADQRRGSAVSALENFGARMTRAVPMDELLLQLTETLAATIAPLAAEVWTGEGGTLTRAISVPERGPGRVTLADAELAAVVGTRVSGTSWMAMWLPEILRDLGEAATVHVRVAPVAHLGKLLGLIVVARAVPDGPFDSQDDALLADLARQVGLALHNVRLDSALQDSLEELQRKNRLLEQSRARVVSAADESRRKIERDLHDGAQQHLVALAVKVQIAKRKVDDREGLLSLLDDLGGQVQRTIDELRELAHGIYPPLLRDQGLEAALRRAADRAALPTRVEVATDRRFEPGVEAAVYFCCLEAMQNASKYAGEGAEIVVRVVEGPGTLRFEVSDSGAGFDVASAAESHGFVNMRDRVGAFGGELTVESTPGHGTVVSGELHVAENEAVGPNASPEPGTTTVAAEDASQPDRPAAAS